MSHTTQKPSLTVLFPGIEHALLNDSPPAYHLNINSLDSSNTTASVPHLKSSCSYLTTILVSLSLPTVAATRQFLAYPTRVQYHLSCTLESQCFFLYNVKSCESDSSKYYISIGVSCESLQRKQSLIDTIDLLTTQDIQSSALTKTVTGTLHFRINDDEDTDVRLNLEASFIDAKSYERLYNRRDAIERGLTLSGNRIKLLRARPMLDQGCDCVWERNLPYIVRDEVQDVHTSLSLLFPSSAIIDEAPSESGKSQKRFTSETTPSDVSVDDADITHESLNDSLRRRRVSHDEDDWDTYSENFEVHEAHAAKHTQQHEESAHIDLDEHTFDYIAGSCAAHNRWVQRFREEGSCGPLQNSQVFLSDNAETTSRVDTKKKD